MAEHMQDIMKIDPWAQLETCILLYESDHDILGKISSL